MKQPVEVRHLSYEGQSDWPPSNPRELIQWIQDLLEATPEEAREEAELNFTGVYSPDGTGVEGRAEFIYYRQETDEEAAKREAKEAYDRKYQDDKDYATYLALKRKFERSE